MPNDLVPLDLSPHCRTTVVEFPGPRPLVGANGYRIPTNPWGRRNFVYSIANSAEEQPVTEEVKRIIREAFDEWRNALGDDFTFTLKETAEEGRAEITIIFYKDDEHPLPDKKTFSSTAVNDEITLAHAFYPLTQNRTLKGHIHINAFVPWEDVEESSPAQNGITANGYKLKSVVLHEIGHVLGLAHSKTPGSIMFKDYRKWPGMVTQQDKDDIRDLYLHGGTVTVSTLDDPRGGGVSAELVVRQEESME